MGNLLMRVGFALAIVAAAIGLSAAASGTTARCDASEMIATSDGALTCPPAPAASHAVAGYQAAPITAERSPLAPAVLAVEATFLIVLATGAVFLSIFVILLSYQRRPGGVRASHR